MKKLLYITNGINGSGGLERVLSIKTDYLIESKNYEIHLVSLNNSSSNLFYKFNENLVFHNINVSGNPLKYIKEYVLGMQETIKKISPDIILVCDDGLKAFFLPLVLDKKIPIIYERHVSKSIAIGKNFGTLKLIGAKIQSLLMSFLAKNFDKFIVLTTENAKEWSSNNVQIIPNPLTFYPTQSSNLQAKKVIAVGKQSYQKGYDRLLQSWQKVLQLHPDWQLEIYGKKDASQGLESLAVSLGIDKNVHFFEPEKDILSKYLSSSIYVMSSRFEGFGMVLIEAMACGLPCVSFDCKCGPSDIIKNNVDGFLVKNDDINALADSLNELISNDALRFEMGKNAKENVKRFLPETIINQWDELFKSLLL